MPRPSKAKGSSLWPKEHGAYFQLALPQLTALGLGWPTAASLLFVAAGVLLFLSHEPLLVALGQRGPRVKEALGARARLRTALLLPGGAALGALGLWLAPNEARLLACIPLTLSLGVAALVVKRYEKTVLGELWVGATFASALLPVAVAGGVDPNVAATASGIWVVGFATATLAVHAVVATVKGGRPWARPAALIVAASALIASALPLFITSVSMGVYALSLSGLAGLALIVARVHPRKLRMVGWTLAGTHALTLVLLVALMRA